VDGGWGSIVALESFFGGVLGEDITPEMVSRLRVEQLEVLHDQSWRTIPDTDPGFDGATAGAITNALEAGIPLRDAQILARPADPRTTEPTTSPRSLDRRGVQCLTAAHVAGI
jgi:hypothetical protein